MKKLILLLMLGLSLPCQAARPERTPQTRHQLRLGWGDMLFETMAFHPGYAQNGTRMSDFGYTGHFFAEYRYHLTRVVSVGLQGDMEGIFWKETPCDDMRTPIGSPTASRNYDAILLPNLRFTFLDTPWVDLYAGLGMGALLAFDNRKQVELAPAVNLNLLGIQVGKGPWSGSLELGALTALKNDNKVYMVGSRLVSVSINYSW